MTALDLPYTLCRNDRLLARMAIPFARSNPHLIAGMLICGAQVQTHDSFAARFALRSGSISAECVSTGFSPCVPVSYTHIQEFVSAGPTLQYTSSRSRRTRWLVRAFAQPMWGCVTDDPPAKGAASSFSAWFAGAAIGAARGIYRLEFEGGVAESERKYRPTIWSLQFAIAP